MNNMYEFPSRVVTLWIIALSLVIGLGASAEATSITWDFAGSGSNGAHIDHSYGDRLDVNYTSRLVMVILGVTTTTFVAGRRL
jgi:hypothetical protein